MRRCCWCYSEVECEEVWEWDDALFSQSIASQLAVVFHAAADDSWPIVFSSSSFRQNDVHLPPPPPVQPSINKRLVADIVAPYVVSGPAGLFSLGKASVEPPLGLQRLRLLPPSLSVCFVFC